ncbi:flagellar biosynthetic protein FliO [Planktomarina temperata]|nr:flagellar biosynthetic protein FliO [Planktomarina temperata]
MSDVQPYQIVIILIFLGALFVAQIVIKRLVASGRVTPIQSDMQIVETLRLSPRENLHLLSVNGENFLLCVGKTGTSNILPVSNSVEEKLDA